jgi:lipopolysaccharide biosynthesis glycosyltransferase
LEEQPTLKKVEILIKHQNDKNTIFTDSDILFYRNFSTLFRIDSDRNYYLVDEGNGYFDEDFMNEYPKIDSPFNFGLIFLNSEIDMSSVVSYILEKIESKKLGYWSDQTAFQKLVMQDHRFQPLDRNLFRVGGSDAFKLSHCVDYNKIALRHFVGPVRHKMWQYPWRKVLGINR